MRSAVAQGQRQLYMGVFVLIEKGTLPGGISGQVQVIWASGIKSSSNIEKHKEMQTSAVLGIICSAPAFWGLLSVPFCPQDPGS